MLYWICPIVLIFGSSSHFYFWEIIWYQNTVQYYCILKMFNNNTKIPNQYLVLIWKYWIHWQIVFFGFFKRFLSELPIGIFSGFLVLIFCPYVKYNAIQWKESKSLCLLIIYKNISTNKLTMSFILEVGYESNFHLYRLAIACSLIKDWKSLLYNLEGSQVLYFYFWKLG